jgi:hypothetical protein
MEIKVQCDCGLRFKFDVEPVQGRMPTAVSCPECGTDATEAANAQLTAVSHEALHEPVCSLRVAKVHRPAAVPVTPSAGVYIVTPDSPPADEPAMCRFHPRTHARWMCTKCLKCYCELCVSSRPSGNSSIKLCRPCGAECSPLNVALVPEGLEKQNFFANIPAAFAFPFRGDGVIFMIAGTLFFALLDFLRGAVMFVFFTVWVLNVIYIGYSFGFVQKIIQTAAQGGDDPPSWPDISDFWSDIFIPFFQTAVLFLACFGPALGFGIAAGLDLASYGEVPIAKSVIAGLLGLGGAIYFPMAFLALALTDSVASANPFVVIPAIAKIPIDYTAVVFLAGLIFSAKVMQQVLLHFVPVPVLPHVVAAGFGLYFLIVQSRLLGLMYYAKRSQLGWFSR